LEKKEGKYHFEFSGKVLGAGAIEFPVVIKARSASKGAIEKVRRAGGEIKTG